ncbi:MerR family transcriptional regulator [Spirosoma gilvum]
MTIKTELIVLTPDDLIGVIQQANAPLIERLEAIEKKTAEAKLFYSTSEVGKLIGVSGRTIRLWVTEGRENHKFERHYLPAKELVRGKFAIQLTDVQKFITLM